MKKLIIFTLMFLFLFSYVSAVRVDYSPNDKGIKDMKAVVKDTILFGLISVGEQGTMELKSHNRPQEIIEVGTGWQVTMIYDTNFKEAHKNILGNVYFYDLKTGEEVEREYKFVYWGTEEREREVCIEYQNITNSTAKDSIPYTECSKYINESYVYEGWLDYNSKDLPKGQIKLGLMTNVLYKDKIDGVWEIQGKKIEKHAGWTSELSVGLVSYYKLDETSGTTVTDSHGSNNGTNNGATVNVAGKIDKAYDFDGTNDYVQIDNEEAMRLSGGSYSISFWFKADSISASRLIWKSYSTGGNVDYDINIADTSAGKIDFRTNDGVLTSSTSVSTGNWYHIVVVRDLSSTGTEQKLYINAGTPVTRASTGTTTTGNDNKKMQIGRYFFGSTAGGYFNGIIDEIGIWSRALSSTEVSELYNSGTGITYEETLNINLLSPINYYNSSSSTIDFSANLTDEGDLGIQNVSLVINDTIYDTNTSGLTGVYNFSETLSDGFYEWYVEAYDDTDEYYTSETRYFTIDTLAPSIEILSPVTSYDYLQQNQTIDLNVSISDASDHLDSCWYEYNSSIIYFNCSENQTFNYIQDQNTLTVYANDTFGNEGSENVSWTTNIILNELNYTESLYETENTSYNINIDYNQSIQTQIKLNYNGTNHSFSNLGSGNFNLNIDIPLVNTTTTYTNKILFISNNSIVHEKEFNQTITPINLALCNGTYTIPALNYTLYDELTQIVINSATNPTTFKSFTEFWLGNGTIKKEYVTNEINKDKRSYAFCILPSNKTYNTNMNVEFSATGYTPRTYALSNAKLTNVSNNVSLYLLNSESAVKFTIEVKKGTNWISDSNIVINKYYLGLNQYIPVSIRTTDASGKFIEYFEIDSKIRFDISQDDVFLGSIEREMLCSATPCEMTLNLEDVSTNPYQLYDETYAENVVYNLKYNSTTKMMTANFLDTTGLATYFRFEVKRKGDELPACDDTIYAPSGSFNCNLTNKDGEYEGTLYVSRSPEKKVDSIFAILSGFVDALGKNGLLIALMMIVIVALVGSWNPAVGIALMSMTILMMGFLNFVAFPQTTIMLILVLSIIIIVRLKS